MAGREKSDGNAPFAMMLDVEFLDRLNEPVRQGKAPSVSAVIRSALARFDFNNLLVMHPAQLQISVRLPARIRQQLKKTARAKHTTIGQLVRAAVENFLPQLEAEAAGQLEIPIGPEPVAPATGASAAAVAAGPITVEGAPEVRRRRPKRKQARPAPARKKSPRSPGRARKGMTRKRKG
jgi:Arc/MetJ-type ribon-helix-helix transcriptional regulator